MLAQLPATTATEVGAWLVVAAVVAWGASQVAAFLNHLKQLRTKQPETVTAREDRPVTRAELEKVERDLSSQLGKHEEYTRTRLHELADAIHTMGMKIAAQPVEMRQMIDASIKPMSDKIDKMALMMAVLVSKSESKLLNGGNGGDD